MAATAGACFPSVARYGRNHLSPLPSSTDPLRLSLLRLPSVTTPFTSLDSLSLEFLSLRCPCGRRASPSISYAVAEEEAAATSLPQIVTEEEEEKEKGEQIEEESGGGGEISSDESTKLYFGNLPYGCDSAQLAGIVQEYGSPELVEVLYDRNTGKSRGFAFVTMSSVEDANAVIQNLDGSEYGGRILKVNFRDKPKAKEPLYPETEYKLFVGNLSWSVTSESLSQIFGEYGNVVGARVLYDGETGKSRGYGFVCYSTKSEMETALQSLDGMDLEGRPIRVSLALGKRQ
ncbi:28 kDa ribonucleoprotein, chloroplastic [Amborella trichopoda]|uniref:RRM domain-containing protein n=1 Tax=Amborella trichopoda TaxID=13333 RepID=W1P0S9_AMBTC|nr:28 kDa ribonucleoprotein, chloroplastic [Amborella trichopoda]ERN01543.1 hypothetical protein AMTR_s00002p00271280 [Amborella trichopoda]|eukprot:XP_006838974.1 28 kDa ribonucleoprotein, chloroplastic [Amborella trichopoda]